MRRRHTWGSVVVALVVIAVLAAVAFVFVRQHQRDEVTMIGDSMSVFSGAELRDDADRAGYHLSIDAQVGIPLAARLDLIAQAAARQPKRVVIELGTNDVLLGMSTESMFANTDAAIVSLQHVPCVVFVNVGILRGPVDQATAFNDHLRSGIATHPNMHEYDWATVYAQHPDWTLDTVHVNEQHRDDYARGVVDTLEGSCGH